MTLQEQYDEAMFDFSRGDFESAVVKFEAVLAADPTCFDARLALGMAHYRRGDYAAAIAEGHKAERLRPREQLVHTNLSLFYMKAGDKQKAEHHGLQAKIESWRTDAAQAREPDPKPGNDAELQIAQPKEPGAKAGNEAELQMARPKPPPIKFPSQPWKKKKVDS